jgi:hypothetical protein
MPSVPLYDIWYAVGFLVWFCPDTFASERARSPAACRHNYSFLKPFIMATIQKGILGGFSGKVGTVVGANWRGQDVIRSVPKKSTRVPTELQQEQRLKFSLVSKFLAPIATLTRNWFGQPSGVKSRRNLALSYHIMEAVAGVFPDYLMDYVKVIITKGELPGPQQATVTPEADAVLAFAWEDNSASGLASPDDLFLAVVYNESKNLFEFRQIALRSAMAFSFALPTNWATDTVQVWSGFISADEKKQANSIFMGSVVLS